LKINPGAATSASFCRGCLRSACTTVKWVACTEEPEGDKIWLEYQKNIVLKRLQKNGLSAQVTLEVQIKMEVARCRIYSAAQEKLEKNSDVR
jgi:predicted Fe-S protein YdhL (DUF1289 family)